MAATPSDKQITDQWSLVLTGAGVVGTRVYQDVLVVVSGSLPTTDVGAMNLMVSCGGSVSNADVATNVYARCATEGHSGTLAVWKV